MNFSLVIDICPEVCYTIFVAVRIAISGLIPSPSASRWRGFFYFIIPKVFKALIIAEIMPIRAKSVKNAA